MHHISSFWSGKTVLVAGATGFLGGWLVRRLLTSGAHVVALIRSYKYRSQFFMESLDKRTRIEWGSVEDQRVIERIFDRYPIDIFFHVAYGADVHRVLDEPLECFKSSALSTWQILDFVRKSRPDCISVISSTDKVYGRQPIPYQEDMPLRPLHPYEAAKASQDYAAQTYGKIFKCPVAITRCGNFFGGYDFNFTRLIPGFIRSILEGDVPILRSNGRFTRDFLYIEDAVDAQLLLAERLAENPGLYGEAFNFSYGERIEVRDIAQRICQMLDAPDNVLVNEKSTAEIPHIELSSEKAKHCLDWKPSVGFVQGLERTVSWYRDHRSALTKESEPRNVRKSGVDRVVDSRFFDGSLKAMIVRDFDGTIRYWSQEAERIYGWTPQEAIGTSTHNLFGTRFPASLVTIEKEVREKTIWQGMLIHTRRDGSQITVNSHWNIQRNPQNQFLTVIEVNSPKAV
ncbi:MAG TPA: NAD-dependent epimerase/dehydratase family protein [Anaerolineales bacterium]|nr:NAD-dependent epimerase/dehydratase family protein [Anaerolineales bacterium]